jgi:hypothetical protein
MGHERVGGLPKSQQWRQIVGGISATRLNPTLVESVANETLRCVRKQFRHIQSDSAVQSAFGFLVEVAVASRDGKVAEVAGREASASVTPLALAMAIRRNVVASETSPEYTSLARDAAIDAFGRWHNEAKGKLPPTLFDEAGFQADSWQDLGNGAGFCELSRHFFASFAERYLNYFLEREVSAALPTIQARQDFKDQLHEHVDAISQHAFETARITQSFAAGWFNKNAASGRPKKATVDGFIAHAMGKMRDEFNRDGGR